MAVNLIIKGGEVATARETIRGGIAVDKGKIVAIADEADLPESNSTIDATNKIIIPGVIDPHVHTSYPLQRRLDDFETVSISGAYGGVTTFLAFFAAAEAGEPFKFLPAYREVITNRIQVDDYFSKLIDDCQHTSVLDFGIHWSLFAGDNPAHIIRQIPTAFKMGITDIKIMLGYHPFRMCLLNDMELMEVLNIVTNNGGIVMVHAENGPALGYLEDKYYSEGRYSKETFLESRPNMIEAEAIYRISALASIVHCPIYIVHNTAKESIRLIREFRLQGQNITAETCPQYLLLSNDDLVKQGAKCKIAPPLRTAVDQNALWQGIQQGFIDTIGSDHSTPDRKAAKEQGWDFRKQPFGMPGIETMLPLLYSEGVAKSRITLNKLVEIMCENSARIFGIYPQKGTISIGADADLVVFDPNVEWEIKASELHSNADYTPYEGWRVKGKPVLSLLRGELLLKDGKLHQCPGFGRYLARSAPMTHTLARDAVTWPS